MDFEEKLKKELTDAPVTLPDSLSKENIAHMAQNAPQEILPMKRGRRHPVLRDFAYAVAALILLIALGTGIDVGYRFFYNQRLERQVQTVAEKTVEPDDPYASVRQAVLTQYLESRADQRRKSSFFAEDLFGWGIKYAVGGRGAAADVDAEFGAASDQNAAAAHSETNVQVKGVDEADIVKTDGRYIYYGSGTEIRVVDASDPARMRQTGLIRLPAGNVSLEGLYLTGKRVVAVFSGLTQEREDGGAEIFTGCAIYDLTDPAAPKEVYQYSVDGALTDSRVVGNRLLLVSGFSVPYQYAYNEDDVTEACEALSGACIPGYRVNGGEKTQLPAEDIVLPRDGDCDTFAIATFIDLSAPSDTPETVSVLAGASKIWCGRENLYITAYSYWHGTDSPDYTIEKFRFADGVFQRVGEGAADGWEFSENSYNMDEYNGYFRIAMNASDGAAVYVFNEKMERVGYLGGIAPGEQIYGVRFDGDRAYLVTFYQTDPLFTIDLSDPKEPKLLGDLEIPGYSAYLHPVADGLMVGVGADGTQDGLNGGAKVSLYDVSDPENPVELDVWTRPNAWADSDPHAFVSLGNGMFSVNVDTYDQDAFIALFRVEGNTLRQIGQYAFLSGRSQRAVFIEQTVFAVNDMGLLAYDGATAERVGRFSFYESGNYGYGDDVIDY